MTLVSFKSKDLAYGPQIVLRQVSLTIEAGEKIALLGQSGSGKSTLLNAIYDQLVQSGKRVALVPQDHALVPQLSVLHNVLMGRLDDQSWLLNLRSLIRPTTQQRADVLALLKELDLAEWIDRPVDTLSGGQKQRTALARALYRGGEVLLADEPVSAIDEQQAPSLLALCARRFSTLCMALHDVELAKEFGTRVIGLRDQSLRFDTLPNALCASQIADLYASA